MGQAGGRLTPAQRHAHTGTHTRRRRRTPHTHKHTHTDTHTHTHKQTNTHTLSSNRQRTSYKSPPAGQYHCVLPASELSLFAVVLQHCCSETQSVTIAVVQRRALCVGATLSALVSRMTRASSRMCTVAVIGAVVLTGTVRSRAAVVLPAGLTLAHVVSDALTVAGAPVEDLTRRLRATGRCPASVTPTHVEVDADTVRGTVVLVVTRRSQTVDRRTISNEVKAITNKFTIC